MTSQEFWLSFLSNFLATFIAGSVIGSIIVLYINRSENQKEKRNIEVEKEIITKKQSLKYLEIIEKEIEEILNSVEIAIKDSKEKKNSRYFHIHTDYWEILKSGGEIPIYLAQSLFRYYPFFIQLPMKLMKYKIVFHFRE